MEVNNFLYQGGVFMRYSIEGEPLPIVICELDNGEMITCEGLFNTVITGPGHIWLHSMPMPQLASALVPFLPLKN